MADAYKHAFQHLAGGASVWECQRATEPVLTLVEANEEFCARFRLSDSVVGKTLDLVLPLIITPAFNAALKAAVESCEERVVNMAVPPLERRQRLSIVPCRSARYIVICAMNAADSTATPRTPDNSRIRSVRPHSVPAHIDLASSPLRKEKITRRPESPHTSIKKARAVFRQLDAGTPLKSGTTELSSVLPLLVAEKNPEAVEHLLSYGANPDGEKSSMTPLYAAIRLGQEGICKQLLSEGASLCKWNVSGSGTMGDACPMQLAMEMDPESPMYQNILEHFEFAEQIRIARRGESGADDEERAVKRARTSL